MRAFLAILFLFSVARAAELPFRAISTNAIHLGVVGKPEWDIFAGQTPQGESLELHFDARPTKDETALVIRQDDVKYEWKVELNGQKLGNLLLMEADVIHWLPIPGGLLRETNNLLKISTRQPEDIVLRGIYLSDTPIPRLLAQSSLSVVVTQEKHPLPCRITIVDENGSLAAIQALPNQLLAVRTGVVYTGDGMATVGLLPGNYTVYATRGPEYSLAQTNLTVHPGDNGPIHLELTREVRTTRWIACDTHVHTRELSGHGDSGLDERMLTLAGEGIELPVCAEHNQHASYSTAAERTKMNPFFTPIGGNEVTTKKGHFNIFPIDPGAKVVDAAIEDWPTLMREFRRTPAVRMVVLNHPCDAHSNFTPFAKTNFLSLTGRNLRGAEFGFDAMEVINSGAMDSDWMEPYRAWFGLLNHGYRTVSVSGSDSHDVSRFIVGQGRTYIQGDDTKPAAININDACNALGTGHAVVSLGLFTTMTVDGGFGPGDLAPVPPRYCAVQIHVAGPSWIAATNVALYLNGSEIKHEAIPPADSLKGGRKALFNWRIPRPAHDSYLVAIATGPGMTAPYWGLSRPYQPSSIHWDGVVIGSTNPIWLDADNDGRFTSARDYALQALGEGHDDPKTVLDRLETFDRAVILQALDLLAVKGHDLNSPAFREIIGKTSAAVQSAYAEILKELP